MQNQSISNLNKFETCHATQVELAPKVELGYYELKCSLKILRIDDVTEFTGLAKSSIYAQIAAGNFPKQVQLSARCRGWRFGDVMKWIKALKEV